MMQNLKRSTKNEVMFSFLYGLSLREKLERVRVGFYLRRCVNRWLLISVSLWTVKVVSYAVVSFKQVVSFLKPRFVMGGI